MSNRHEELDMDTATITHDDLAVCINCAFVLANGVESEDDQTAADGMVEQWGRQADGLVLNCPEDCEGWFSSSPCDGCGSSLGGDRHPAVCFAV